MNHKIETEATDLKIIQKTASSCITRVFIKEQGEWMMIDEDKFIGQSM